MPKVLTWIFVAPSNHRYHRVSIAKGPITKGRPKNSRENDLSPIRMTFSGWWLGHPSEKYESQLGWLFPIYGKIKTVPNHQPVLQALIFHRIRMMFDSWMVHVAVLHRKKTGAGDSSLMMSHIWNLWTCCWRFLNFRYVPVSSQSDGDTWQKGVTFRCKWIWSVQKTVTTRMEPVKHLVLHTNHHCCKKSRVFVETKKKAAHKAFLHARTCRPTEEK